MKKVFVLVKSFVKFLIVKLSLIEKDDLLHFLCCQIISFVVTKLLLFILHDMFISSMIALSVAMLIGIAKELSDTYQDKIDIKDIRSDLVGAIIGILMAIARP